MDCLTLRRIKLAVPQDAGPGVIEHLRDCAGCRTFVRELENLEHHLHEVARVPVPEGLAEQIILRHRRPRWFNPGGWNPRWFSRNAMALAASVMLAVSALVGYYAVQSSRDELAASFVAHVESEPEVLRAHEYVEPAKIRQAFARYGGELEGTIGEVRHLGRCPIDGVLADHILVQTAHGAVTLILIPERRATLSSPRTLDGYSVVILPLRHGSLGIIADSAAHATEVGKLIQSQVRWRT
jgi:hypothetical protein